MEKIWQNSYQEGVAKEINPEQYQSLVQMLDLVFQTCPDKVAFKNFGVSLTYRQLKHYADNFAAYLQQKLGLEKGERFAIMLPNLLQYPIAIFAALRLGLIIVNINPLYKAREIEQQLQDSGASTILVLENFAHELELALPRTEVRHVIISRLADLFPQPRQFMTNFAIKYFKHLVPAHNLSDAKYFKSVLEQGAGLTMTAVDLQLSDIVLLQYTGGTTGVPKAAVITHRNIVANVQQVVAWLTDIQQITHVIITALPLYHIFAFTANMFIAFELQATNILITNPRDIASMIKQIRTEPFSIFTGVNTLFNALLRHPEFHKLDFSHLRYSLGGGMAVQKPVAQKWQQITGVPLIEAYGLTEASPVVCINPLHLQAFNGSIGLPIPSTDIRICDDNGHELAVGEVGELFVKGPQVMAGYWNQPDETKITLTPESWLRTGDIARVDSAGFVYLVDRKKDVINVSGFNVYPNEVEEVIADMSGILEVAVVGVPTDKNGEVVKAFVVVEDKTLTLEKILQHCQNNLAAYKRPKYIEFKAELPKSNVGKILRKDLRTESSNVN